MEEKKKINLTFMKRLKNCRACFRTGLQEGKCFNYSGMLLQWPASKKKEFFLTMVLVFAMASN